MSAPAPTPTIESALSAWRDAALAQIEVFRAAMARSPWHAARHTGSLCGGAARLAATDDALSLVRDLREAGCDDAEVKRRLLGELRRSVLDGAIHVPVRRSSSVGSDEADRLRLSARARLLEGLTLAWPTAPDRPEPADPSGWTRTADRLPPPGRPVAGYYPHSDRPGDYHLLMVRRIGDDWFDAATGHLDTGLDGVARVPKLWTPIPALPSEEEIEE